MPSFFSFFVYKQDEIGDTHKILTNGRRCSLLLANHIERLAFEVQLIELEQHTSWYFVTNSDKQAYV